MHQTVFDYRTEDGSRCRVRIAGHVVIITWPKTLRIFPRVFRAGSDDGMRRRLRAARRFVETLGFSLVGPSDNGRFTDAGPAGAFLEVMR